MKYWYWMALILLLTVAGCASRADYSSSSQAPVTPISGSSHGAGPAVQRQATFLHFSRARQGQPAMQRTGTSVASTQR